MTAEAHFAAGQLAEAIAAQVQAVKAAPLDAGLRTFLFELLAFAGEWDRADKQLQALGQEDAERGWGISVYQNLLAAEKARRQVFAGGAKPEVFLDAPVFLAQRWDAIAQLSVGQSAAALELLQRSDAAAPPVRGTLNDQPVENLRDADDLLAPILEVMVLRDYVWVPWSQIRELEVEPPKHPRDLLWAPARLVLADGEQRRCYLPALYPGTYAESDDALKLGRLTDWRVPEDDGPVRGVGQHLFAAGDRDLGLLEVREFEAT
ncbi:MAG: type VI secretion system accessory protein TagJ [Pirellulaceae bacterium]